jgi:hypothetical protein
VWNYITGLKLYQGFIDQTINFISSYDPDANLIFKTWTRPSLIYINLTYSSPAVTRVFEPVDSNINDPPSNHELDLAYNRIDQCIGGTTNSFISF